MSKYLSVPLLSSVATLSCQRALLLSTSPVQTSDVECQVSEGVADGWEVDVSYLSQEHLEHELQTLCQERDKLTARLKESTETFQEQLKLLADKGNKNCHHTGENAPLCPPKNLISP